MQVALRASRETGMWMPSRSDRFQIGRHRTRAREFAPQQNSRAKSHVRFVCPSVAERYPAVGQACWWSRDIA